MPGDQHSPGWVGSWQEHEDVRDLSISFKFDLQVNSG
jgi:hypothetical protein